MIIELHRRIEDCDLLDWTGLPGELTVEQSVEAGLAQHLAETGRGRLGTPPSTMPWWSLRTTRYKIGLRAWAADHAIVMIEGEFPVEPDGSPVVGPDLGTPADSGPAYLAGLRLDNAFRVFPDRGLAVAVNPENGNLLTVWFFAPTTLDDFTARLRPDLDPGVLR